MLEVASPEATQGDSESLELGEERRERYVDNFFVAVGYSSPGAATRAHL
jgi:hypothetical protein